MRGFLPRVITLRQPHRVGESGERVASFGQPIDAGMAPDDEATGITLDTVPGARSGGVGTGLNATATAMIACRDHRTRTLTRVAAPTSNAI